MIPFSILQPISYKKPSVLCPTPRPSVIRLIHSISARAKYALARRIRNYAKVTFQRFPFENTSRPNCLLFTTLYEVHQPDDVVVTACHAHESALVLTWEGLFSADVICSCMLMGTGVLRKGSIIS